MTKVRFEAEQGVWTGFQASGHAGYAERGQDIVCAAISALTQATVLGLTEVVRVPVNVQQDDQKGQLSAHICWEACPVREIESSQILLATLKMALESLQQSYPQELQVSVKERR